MSTPANIDFAVSVWEVVFTPDRAGRPVAAAAPGRRTPAGRPVVPFEALADFAHAMPPDMPDYWEDGYLSFHTARGKPIERIEQVTNADELIHLVSTGEIVHPFPSHVTRYWSMSHVRFIPVPDMGTISYGLVWRRDAESDPVRALAQTVRDLGVLHF
ncbi:LysR substrate-binding domain-containing protein [Kitasatospora sp. NPDC050467]|uniref:LysR substrate-binding domain-containing protein n=1 Tax=Kitasatospora sp. NPDC050467 TaxID=3364053 RepID=UPI003795BFC3